MQERMAWFLAIHLITCKLSLPYFRNQFFPLNSFCTQVRKLFKFSLNKRQLLSETIWDFQGFKNSNKNSFHSNCLRKYGIQKVLPTSQTPVRFPQVVYCLKIFHTACRPLPLHCMPKVAHCSLGWFHLHSRHFKIQILVHLHFDLLSLLIAQLANRMVA